LLTLNQWGEIDISGRVKTGSGLEVVSGNVILPAGSVNYTELSITSSIQGSDLTSDIDINTTGNISISGTLNATGTFQLNSTAVAATATELNYLSGVTSNVQTQLGAKLGLSGGTMTGNLAMSGNDLFFGDDVSFGYLDPVAPDDFIIAVSSTSNDTIVISNEGSGDIEIITDGTGDVVLESGGSNGVIINNSDLVFTSANDIALQSGTDLGLYNGEGVIRFTDAATNEISIFNANLIMNTNNIVFNNTYGMVSSTGAGSLVFQPGGDNFSMTGSLTLSDSTVNAIIVFDGTGDHGIGFGSGDPYINFNDGGSGTITVQDSDFVVEGNNNYYVCTSQPNCVQVPDAATGRTITVRNNSGGAINQFDAINLLGGSDGLATTIAAGEIVYAVYDGTNWVIIGAGH